MLTTELLLLNRTVLVRDLRLPIHGNDADAVVTGDTMESFFLNCTIEGKNELNRAIIQSNNRVGNNIMSRYSRIT